MYMLGCVGGTDVEQAHYTQLNDECEIQHYVSRLWKFIAKHVEESSIFDSVKIQSESCSILVIHNVLINYTDDNADTINDKILKTKTTVLPTSSINIQNVNESHCRDIGTDNAANQSATACGIQQFHRVPPLILSNNGVIKLPLELFFLELSSYEEFHANHVELVKAWINNCRLGDKEWLLIFSQRTASTSSYEKSQRKQFSKIQQEIRSFLPSPSLEKSRCILYISFYHDAQSPKDTTLFHHQWEEFHLKVETSMTDVLQKLYIGLYEHWKNCTVTFQQALPHGVETNNDTLYQPSNGPSASYLRQMYIAVYSAFEQLVTFYLYCEWLEDAEKLFDLLYAFTVDVVKDGFHVIALLDDLSQPTVLPYSLTTIFDNATTTPGFFQSMNYMESRVYIFTRHLKLLIRLRRGNSCGSLCITFLRSLVYELRLWWKHHCNTNSLAESLSKLIHYSLCVVLLSTNLVLGLTSTFSTVSGIHQCFIGFIRSGNRSLPLQLKNNTLSVKDVLLLQQCCTLFVFALSHWRRTMFYRTVLKWSTVEESFTNRNVCSMLFSYKDKQDDVTEVTLTTLVGHLESKEKAFLIESALSWISFHVTELVRYTRTKQTLALSLTHGLLLTYEWNRANGRTYTPATFRTTSQLETARCLITKSLNSIEQKMWSPIWIAFRAALCEVDSLLHQYREELLGCYVLSHRLLDREDPLNGLWNPRERMCCGHCLTRGPAHRVSDTGCEEHETPQLHYATGHSNTRNDPNKSLLELIFYGHYSPRVYFNLLVTGLHRPLILLTNDSIRGSIASRHRWETKLEGAGLRRCQSGRTLYHRGERENRTFDTLEAGCDVFPQRRQSLMTNTQHYAITYVDLVFSAFPCLCASLEVHTNTLPIDRALCVYGERPGATESYPPYAQSLQLLTLGHSGALHNPCHFYFFRYPVNPSISTFFDYETWYTDTNNDAPCTLHIANLESSPGRKIATTHTPYEPPPRALKPLGFAQFCSMTLTYQMKVMNHHIFNSLIPRSRSHTGELTAPRRDTTFPTDSLQTTLPCHSRVNTLNDVSALRSSSVECYRDAHHDAIQFASPTEEMTVFVEERSRTASSRCGTSSFRFPPTCATERRYAIMSSNATPVDDARPHHFLQYILMDIERKQLKHQLSIPRQYITHAQTLELGHTFTVDLNVYSWFPGDLPIDALVLMYRIAPLETGPNHRQFLSNVTFHAHDATHVDGAHIPSTPSTPDGDYTVQQHDLPDAVSFMVVYNSQLKRIPSGRSTITLMGQALFVGALYFTHLYILHNACVIEHTFATLPPPRIAELFLSAPISSLNGPLCESCCSLICLVACAHTEDTLNVASQPPNTSERLKGQFPTACSDPSLRQLYNERSLFLYTGHGLDTFTKVTCIVVKPPCYLTPWFTVSVRAYAPTCQWDARIVPFVLNVLEIQVQRTDAACITGETQFSFFQDKALSSAHSLNICWNACYMVHVDHASDTCAVQPLGVNVNNYQDHWVALPTFEKECCFLIPVILGNQLLSHNNLCWKHPCCPCQSHTAKHETSSTPSYADLFAKCVRRLTLHEEKFPSGSKTSPGICSGKSHLSGDFLSGDHIQNPNDETMNVNTTSVGVHKRGDNVDDEVFRARCMKLVNSVYTSCSAQHQNSLKQVCTPHAQDYTCPLSPRLDTYSLPSSLNEARESDANHSTEANEALASLTHTGTTQHPHLDEASVLVLTPALRFTLQDPRLRHSNYKQTTQEPHSSIPHHRTVHATNHPVSDNVERHGDCIPASHLGTFVAETLCSLPSPSYSSGAGKREPPLTHKSPWYYTTLPSITLEMCTLVTPFIYTTYNQQRTLLCCGVSIQPASKHHDKAYDHHDKAYDHQAPSPLVCHVNDIVTEGCHVEDTPPVLLYLQSTAHHIVHPIKKSVDGIDVMRPLYHGQQYSVLLDGRDTQRITQAMNITMNLRFTPQFFIVPDARLCSTLALLLSSFSNDFNRFLQELRLPYRVPSAPRETIVNVFLSSVPLSFDILSLVHHAGNELLVEVAVNTVTTTIYSPITANIRYTNTTPRPLQVQITVDDLSVQNAVKKKWSIITFQSSPTLVNPYSTTQCHITLKPYVTGDVELPPFLFTTDSHHVEVIVNWTTPIHITVLPIF